MSLKEVASTPPPGQGCGTGVSPETEVGEVAWKPMGLWGYSTQHPACGRGEMET